MAALTTDRDTPARNGFTHLERTVASGVTVHAGSMVGQLAVSATAAPMGTNVNMTALGRAEMPAAAGASLVISRGVFRFNNSGADPVTLADYGKTAYAVDDHTVARTNGSNTRAAAGIVRDVDAAGVWVEF